MTAESSVVSEKDASNACCHKRCEPVCFEYPLTTSEGVTVVKACDIADSGLRETYITQVSLGGLLGGLYRVANQVEGVF